MALKKAFLYISLALTLMWLSGCAEKANTPASSKGFDSPEAAMEAFAGKIAALDTAGALACFSSEHKVELYNFASYTDRMQVFMPINGCLPNEFDAYKQLNEALFYSQAATQVKMFMLGFLVDSSQDITSAIPLKDLDMTSAELLTKLDPAPLANLKLLRTDLARPDLQESDTYLKSVENNGKSFGYIGSKDYVALYELNGQHYASGFVVVEYEDGWYIENLTSMLAGMSIYSVTPITEQEYLDILE